MITAGQSGNAGTRGLAPKLRPRGFFAGCRLARIRPGSRGQARPAEKGGAPGKEKLMYIGIGTVVVIVIIVLIVLALRR
jgi:hypothetical protein